MSRVEPAPVAAVAPALEGRVALITGGTRGIGRAIAESLHAAGAAVAITGRSDEKGQRALAEMGGGDRVHYICGDVTRQADCEEAVAATVTQFGGIDILVNNAGGGGETALVHELSDEAWLTGIAFNLNHPFWCTRAALHHMLPNRWGRIINMSSMYGKVPLAGVAPYVASKHAINGLTKTVAQEVGEHGITCNAICPGVILTDVWEESGPGSAAALGMEYEEYVAMIVASAALKRPNTVEEVAALALLLCSPAGAGITGACLSVDGGSTPY